MPVLPSHSLAFTIHHPSHGQKKLFPIKGFHAKSAYTVLLYGLILIFLQDLGTGNF